MGGTQSNESAVPVRAADGSANGAPSSASGVRVSGAMVDEARSGEGMMDRAAVKHTMEALAAQVYDSVHAQLSTIQSDSLQKSQKMVRPLRCINLNID